MNLNLSSFPSMTIDSDLNKITDDDITLNQENSPTGEQIEKPAQVTGEEQVKPEPVDPETSESNEIENTDQEEPDNTDEPEVDNLTQAEALVELLGTEGLQIYNEIPKGLTMEQFIKDIPEYIGSIEQEIRRDEATKLGKFQEYYEMMSSGISGEELKPAMLLENIVEADLNNPTLTTADLIDIVKTKHLLRGLSEHEADALAGINSKNIEALKAEAIASQGFVSEYIENIKEDVRSRKEYEQEQEKAAFEQEQQAFVQVLNQSAQYSKEQKKELFDIRYKRDQQVSWTDDEGNVQRDFVTKYDVLMHQIQTDPNKLLDIIEYMNSGFDMKKAVKADVENSYAKKLFAKLEGRTVVNNSKNNRDESTKPVSQFNSVTF